MLENSERVGVEEMVIVVLKSEDMNDGTMSEEAPRHPL